MTEETIFENALQKRDPGERAAFLEQACGGDAELRQRVEALLQAHDQAGDYLERPAPEQVAAKAGQLAGTEASDSHPPARDSADETQTHPPADEGAPVLDFLGPPRKEGSLGRLAHYEILEVLGRGGFGIVLKAFDEKLQRVVAVKVLSPQLASSGTARKRFLREAHATAAVRHENVIDIHAIDDDPLPYLVMECVSGQTLQEKLDQRGPLEVKEILRIGHQIASGLAAAHAQGLIHRDIKPSNILLENGVERVKITDFGLARAVDDASLTQSGVVAGTPLYMAPEQAAGEPLDHRADLFSLGSTLYVMCTGRPPFRASGTMAVLKRVIEDTPRPVCEINPEMPDWLDAIVRKLHAKRREDRFQSAKEVADLLEQHLAHLQRPSKVPLPEKVQPPEQGGQPPTSQAWRGWLFAGYALLLLASLILSLYLGWPSGPRTAGPGPGLDDNLMVILDDPRLRVEVMPEAGGLHGIVSDSLEQGLQLPPGKYQVRVVHRDTHALVYQEWVTLKAGEKKTVRMESGWVQLFNGKDLTGWTPFGPFKWNVVNGEIVGQGDETHPWVVDTSWLATTRIFADFHLRAKVKFSGKPEASGAIILRDVGKDAPHARVLIGNVGGSSLEPGRQEGGTGSLGVFAEGKLNWPGIFLKDLVGPNTWFTLEIIARGQEVTVKVNNTQTAQAVLKIAERGFLSFEAYGPGTVIRFRKIEIKELPPSKAATAPLAVAPFDAAKAKEHQEAWAKHLGVDVEITNSIGMKLRLIPPGEFLMGTTEEERTELLQRLADENAAWYMLQGVRSEPAAKRVPVPGPFYAGVHEVTVEQFRRFATEKGHKTDGEKSGEGGWGQHKGKWERRPEHQWNTPGAWALRDDQPVVHVSWRDALAFCAWLSAKEGRTYTLPTEAQWELAARAGTTKWFGASDDSGALVAHAWFMHSLPAERPLQPQPVGLKLANAFGLYDMLGNVWEWSADSATVGHRRLLRGGSWYLSALHARTNSRGTGQPDMAWDAGTGFRVIVVGSLKPKMPVAE
ncbi:MAG: SUMF1/EgtB/PvdO family nonheme iron enzyme [Gemmataceae bacterium]|nr:SUMF1/EgtB/PvdO family nonheme iron enzyme [Gemmataceae bacterium]